MASLEEEIDILRSDLINISNSINRSIQGLKAADRAQAREFAAGFDALSFSLADSLGSIGENQKIVIDTQRQTFRSLGDKLEGAQRESIGNLSATVNLLDSERNASLNDLVIATEVGNQILGQALIRTTEEQLETLTTKFQDLRTTSLLAQQASLNRVDNSVGVVETLVSVLSGDLIGGLTGVVGSFVPDLTVLAVDLLGSVFDSLTPNFPDVIKLMGSIANMSSNLPNQLIPPNRNPEGIRVARE